MDLNKIGRGIKVKTASHLGRTTGMLIGGDALANRAPDTKGTVLGYVAGHDGDVWWVRHDGGDKVGAYMFTEFEASGE